MTDISENGWPVLTRSQLHWFTAAGQRFAAGNADVGVLAGYLITQFDAHVERIHGNVLDDWSWASRPVRGQTTGFSNHASATAWDLNATKHPRGVRGTFTATQISAVRKILAKIVDSHGHRIFRWGNDYTTATVDAMHFEINATRAQVAQARLKLEDEMPLTNADADLVAKRLLATTVELSAASASAMSADGVSHKAGDKVSMSYIWQWGGAGLFRALSEIRALEARNAALTAVVGAMAANANLDASAIESAARAGAQAALAEQGLDTDPVVTDPDIIDLDDAEPSDPAQSAVGQPVPDRAGA